MFDMLLSAWMMQETANAAWAFNPTREVIASEKSAWVTSNPPYQAKTCYYSGQYEQGEDILWEIYNDERVMKLK